MTLLELYTEYVRPLKGSDKFHQWSFITCVAGLLERRVWLDKGRFGILYPNMYTLLVGPPATGKSTSANIMVNFVQNVKPPGNRGPRIGPTKITQAALYKELKESEREVPLKKSYRQSPVFIYASELAINIVDFGGGTLTNELIDFYDSKGHDTVMEKRTISDGTLTLMNPSVTLLGCTTAGFLQAAAQDKLISSGLASRIVFVVETEHVPKQRATVDLDHFAHKAILTGLEKIYAMKGPMTFTSEAYDVFVMLSELSDNQCYEESSEFFQNYFGRKPDHIAKISMALAAMRGSHEIVLTDVQTALRWLESCEPAMQRAFGMRAIDQDPDLAFQLLPNIPKAPKWIARSEMLHRMYLAGKFVPMSSQFEATMRSLVHSRKILVQHAGNEELYSRVPDDKKRT